MWAFVARVQSSIECKTGAEHPLGHMRGGHDQQSEASKVLAERLRFVMARRDPQGRSI